MKAVFRTLLSRPEIAALVMMLLLVVGFYSYAPVFLSTGNARIILAIVPELGLVALGVTLLMISGEFDLSVGSMFAFGGLLPFVLVQSHGVDPWLGFVIATAAALVVGYINGFITLASGFPPSSPPWGCCSSCAPPRWPRSTSRAGFRPRGRSRWTCRIPCSPA